MVIIAVIVMILVLIGMLVCKKTMANSSMLQPVLFLCVALELGLVIFVFYNQLFGGGGSGTIIEKQKRLYRSRGFIAGEFLKGKEGGKKLLLINTPGSSDNQMAQALIKGFKDQYGEIEVDEIVNTAPEGDIMEITAKDINPVLAKHPGIEVVAYNGTFPGDYGRVNFKGKTFLFETGGATYAQVEKEIKGGRVLGVIFPKRGVRFKVADPVDKDEKKAFEQRYVLINQENIGSYGEYFK